MAVKNVPIEVGLSLSLWTEQGIPTFVLPLEQNEGPRVVTTALSCSRLRKRIAGEEHELARSFRRGFEDVVNPAEEDSLDLGVKDDVGRAVAGKSFAEGVMVLLLSGNDELELVKRFACRLSKGNRLRIYVADLKGGRRTTFDAGDQCRLELLPVALKAGRGSDAFSRVVEQELGKVGPIEVIFFLRDGQRGEQFGDILRKAGGIMGDRSEGRWNGRRSDVESGGTVVIGLRTREVEAAEWISTLSIEAIRREFARL